jgi:hypothetical protein
MNRYFIRAFKVIRSGDLPSVILFLNKTSARRLIRFIVDIWYWKLRKRRKIVGESVGCGDEDKSLLTNLRTQGYTHLPEKFGSEKVLVELASGSHEKLMDRDRLKAEQVYVNKKFWVRLLDDEIKKKGLTSESPFVKFAIQDRILKLVASYLGEAPYLGSVTLTFSEHSQEKLKSSQLWHLDRDDVRMCKMFVYLTDVEDDDSGPFTFYDKTLSGKITQTFLGGHYPDEVVFPQVGKEPPIKMKGKKLAAFIVDTSRCFHMGSRVAPGSHRLLYTALFVTVPGIYIGGNNENIRITSELSLLQRLAIEQDST